jgi:hypothetical protein
LLVRSGELAPMKPGEHRIAGTGGGLDEAAIARADMAARFRGRAARGVDVSDAVVEMDYEDYTGTQPGTREAADADEPFAVGEGEEPDEFDLGDEGDDLPPEDDEPTIRRSRRPAPLHASGLTDAEEILKGQDDLRQRLEGIASGMLALAEGLGAALERIEHPLVVVEADPDAAVLEAERAYKARHAAAQVAAHAPVRVSEPEVHVPRWLRVLGVRTY